MTIRHRIFLWMYTELERRKWPLGTVRFAETLFRLGLGKGERVK